MPSIAITHIHYQHKEKILVITFVSGKVYAYEDVPVKIYEDFKSAFSKGTYFNNYIKGNYAYKEIS